MKDMENVCLKSITRTFHFSYSALVAYVHRINQLTPHPTQPSSLISAASGNNEVSVWDMETAARRQMIWASPAQPFSPMTDNVREFKDTVDTFA